MKTDLPDLSLLFVVGTSLTVQPVSFIPEECCNSKRVIVNREDVANYTKTPGKDFFLSGDCDDTFIEIIVKCGWLQDLMKFKDEMSDSC